MNFYHMSWIHIRWSTIFSIYRFTKFTNTSKLLWYKNETGDKNSMLQYVNYIKSFVGITKQNIEYWYWILIGNLSSPVSQGLWPNLCSIRLINLILQCKKWFRGNGILSKNQFRFPLVVCLLGKVFLCADLIVYL